MERTWGKTDQGIGAKWNTFGGKMEWCHFAPLHFAPQCHFAPTFHVPFCPRDYVWRKAIMSIINIARCSWCENENERYIIIFNHMQRFYYLICQSNWCQNASKLIYQKGEISFLWDTQNVVYCKFDFDVWRWTVDDRNQMDVKIDPHHAGFFQNTRCSILPPCSILPRLTITPVKYESGFKEP